MKAILYSNAFLFNESEARILSMLMYGLSVMVKKSLLTLVCCFWSNSLFAASESLLMKKSE